MVQRGPWKTDPSFDATELHIRPRADTRWHPLDAGCWCGPLVKGEATDGEGVAQVYVHRPADGREAPEKWLG